jgi:hypothetical protein
MQHIWLAAVSYDQRYILIKRSGVNRLPAKSLREHKHSLAQYLLRDPTHRRSAVYHRASAPMIPHRVHTMRGPNVGTGTSSAQVSALRMARWWHCQQDTSSERTPFARVAEGHRLDWRSMSSRRRAKCDLRHGRFLRRRLGTTLLGTLLKQQRRPAMKTLITTLTLASLIASSALAETGRVRTRDANSIYQSYSQGNQTFPNPDRDFDGQNARHPAQTW